LTANLQGKFSVAFYVKLKVPTTDEGVRALDGGG
jgi:hypothetical protein